MGTRERETVTVFCSGCGASRRRRFSGYATPDGRENTIRPRAFYSRCETCGKTALVLGDVTDAEHFVATLIEDWRRANGVHVPGAVGSGIRSLDRDDMEGDLCERIWALYSRWDPTRLSFRSYAAGLLRKRISSYVLEHVGGTELYRRNGHGSLYRVWPKAHSLAVCVSADAVAEQRAGGLDADRGEPDRLDGSLGPVGRDFADDRSSDLARLLGL